MSDTFAFAGVNGASLYSYGSHQIGGNTSPPVERSRQARSLSKQPGGRSQNAEQTALTIDRTAFALSLFEQRNPHDVRLYFPRTGSELWCSSTMLRATSPYFKDLLDSGFSESSTNTTTVLTPIPSEEDLTSSPRLSRRPDSETGLAQLGAEGGAGESGTMFEDSDDEEERTNPPPRAPKSHPRSPASAAPFHEIIVQDATYTTYRALLSWLLTSNITFRPLRSTLLHRPDSVSPKSIYRLADFLSLPSLKSLALASIKSQLSVMNVAEELFGDVARCFDEVREVEMEFAARCWEVVKDSEGMRTVERRLEEGGAGAEGIGLTMLVLARRLKSSEH
ncbi:hypothetical protein T439DRAFT_329311 [Meredithblackwellia eburnea MCA 4105]